MAVLALRRLVVRVVLIAAGGGALAVSPALALSPRSLAAPLSDTGAYVLTATNAGGNYAPTFTCNSDLGLHVPAVGQGCVGGTVPAQSELAEFYAQRTTDVLKFPSTAASFVHLEIAASNGSTPPML